MKMKIKIFYYFIFNSILFVSSFKCGHDKIQIIPKILNDSIIKDNKTRRLDSPHSISFFVDYTQMDYDKYGNDEYRNFLKSSINSTLKIFSELLKVKNFRGIRFSEPINCYKITKYSQSIITGVDDDIILVPIIDPTLEDGVLAASGACYILKYMNKTPVKIFKIFRIMIHEAALLFLPLFYR